MSETNDQQNDQAMHGGGVKTEAGKEISKYNAQRHSILRETLTDYEKIDADQIYADLVQDLEPKGRFQELLVEVITSNIVRLQRIAKAEGELMKSSMATDTLDDRISFRSYEMTLTVSSAERLLIYSRYQTATENRIYRAMAILKQLKQHEQGKETTEE